MIKNHEFSNIDYSDYPDFVDAYISYAECECCGAELSDSELEKINNNNELVYQLLLDYLF